MYSDSFDEPGYGAWNTTTQQAGRSGHRKGARLGRRMAAFVLSIATLGACAIGAGASTSPASADTLTTSEQNTLGNSTFEAPREKYGLAKDMKDGTILHAWMWSFDTIKDNMADIAAAGYTSIQTEPMSAVKTVASNGKKFTDNWYYVYQPTDTTIGNFVVGSEDDLKAMTAEAHKYGVRIIVDVVANHFTSDWNAIASDWKDTSLFHSRSNCSGTNGDNIDYSNRWQVTQCHLLGLWDINTQNQTAADKMQSFLKEAVADGVDGFRFDAAKHVELPNEFSTYSTYWNTILNNGAQYQYGEVLQGDSNLPYSDYANLFNSASSNGGGVTASSYGYTVRSAISSKNLAAGNISSFSSQGVSSDKLVTWVESHDNYANGDKVSTGLNDWQLKMGWVLVAARDGGTPLYFNRPKGSGGSNAQFAEVSQLGDAGDDMWKDPSVVAVNHFHNQMDGNAEYLRNCQGNDSCLMVERYKTDSSSADDGVAIANMSDSAIDLSGSATTLDDGTYTDQVNGGTITVSGGKITSGTATADAVSVYYNPSGTVTEPVDPVTTTSDTTIYYPSSKFGADSTYLYYRVNGGSWTSGNGVKMEAACDGYVKYTIANTNGKTVDFVFNNGSGTWDNKNNTSGQNYSGSGTTLVWTSQDGTLSSTAPCAASDTDEDNDDTDDDAASTTIYYPSSKFGADSTYLYYKVGDGDWTSGNGVKMTAACDGYVKYTIPDTNGETVTFVFNNGSGSWDNKNNTSGQNYSGSGSVLVWTSQDGTLSATAPCTAS